MIQTKRERQIQQIELVETYNIKLSIQRIINMPGHDYNQWKRALYHALGMAGVDSSLQTKIREALGLP